MKGRERIRGSRWHQAHGASPSRGGRSGGWATDSTNVHPTAEIRYHEPAAIMNSGILIGMSPNMVREASGAPDHINRTITAAGTSEQRVYSRNHVYFDGGRVTAIQDSTSDSPCQTLSNTRQSSGRILRQRGPSRLKRETGRRCGQQPRFRSQGKR
jgi:hypothetical protein